MAKNHCEDDRNTAAARLLMGIAVETWASVYVRELKVNAKLAPAAARSRLWELYHYIHARMHGRKDVEWVTDDSLVDWYRGGGQVSTWVMEKRKVREMWVRVARCVADAVRVIESA